MKLDALLRHLRRHGCVLRREGKEHALWGNPETGHAEAVPRHSEIGNILEPRESAVGSRSQTRRDRLRAVAILDLGRDCHQRPKRIIHGL
jgi:hypothetical protein